METFDADISHFDPRNPYKGDERIPVQFYMGAIPDDAKTEELGRPIFKDVECIKIFNSKDNIIDRPVRDTDIKRWPGAYGAWKQTGASEAGSVGTRLEHWPVMTRAQVEEYKYFKVYTIEQLAELPDSTVQKIMGASKLKQLARLAVEAAKGEAPFMKLQAQIDAKDGVISELQSEVKRLTEMVTKLAKGEAVTA